MWAAIVGALLGWIACDFASYGLLLGAAPGAVVGLILRGAVRREIARSTAELRAQVAALMAASRDVVAVPGISPVITAEALASAPPSTPVTRADATATPVPSPPTPLREPLPPPEPSPAERAAALALGRVRAWLLGGNTVGRACCVRGHAAALDPQRLSGRHLVDLLTLAGLGRREHSRGRVKLCAGDERRSSRAA